MGRIALLLVLSLTLTIGIISYSITTSKKFTVENVTGFDKYTTARNLSHTGVNLMLHRIDTDTAFVSRLNGNQTQWVTTSLTSGVCSVSVKLKNAAALDTVMLTSISHISDTTYRMNLTLQRFPKPFPTIGAPVSFTGSPVNFTMNGNPSIDGRDHLINGSLTASRATDTVGVAVSTALDSVTVSGYNSKITGDPTKIRVQSTDDPSAYVQEYINAAQQIFTPGNYSGSYGSQTNPIVGYVNGDIHFGGNGSFYGVLVVNGSIDLQGTFDLYGLIICIGDSNTIGTSAGTPEIHGGIIVAGDNVKFTMKGTADATYSTEALNVARYTTRLLAYKVMKWYE